MEPRKISCGEADAVVKAEGRAEVPYWPGMEDRRGLRAGHALGGSPGNPGDPDASTRQLPGVGGTR